MRQPRVLVVDDDATLLRVLERLVRSLGFEVVVTSSPRAALVQIEHGTFDVILSDIEMPEMFGTELVACIRARGILTPVVLMSGNLSAPQPFLEKPFTLRDLVALFVSIGVEVPKPPQR